MAIICLGDQVSFVMDGDGDFERGEVLELPENYGYIQDFNGELFRRCDLFFLPYTHNPDGGGLSHSDIEIREQFRKYYGEGEQCMQVVVDIPRHPWRLIGHAIQFRYRRYGEHKALYQHGYAMPQPIFMHGDGEAYRVSHPDWCVVNHRGVVHP